MPVPSTVLRKWPFRPSWSSSQSPGVTLDSFSHVPIQFIGKSWLKLKNTSRIQTMSHPLLQPTWASHLSPGLGCSLLTVLPASALHTPPLQYIFNIVARVILPNPSHIMPFPCPKPSLASHHRVRAKALVLRRPCMTCPPVPSNRPPNPGSRDPRQAGPDSSHEQCSSPKAFELLILQHPHGSLSLLPSLLGDPS